MKRRNAILTVLAASVGFLSNRAKAGEPVTGTPWQTDSTLSVVSIQPMAMTFNLDTFKSFTFTQGKDTITLTPVEMMTALKGQ